MAEWKKVIVSGSAAELSSLTLDTGLANTELANDGITIAGVDTSLGGAITAATIGNAIGAFSASAQVTGIGTTQISNDAVTNAKLANITRGSVKVGGTSNAPTDLDAKTSGQILVGDGTDINSVAVSGDVALAANGAVTIQSNAVEGSMLNSNVAGSGLDYGSNELSVDVSDFMTNGSNNRIVTATGTDAMNAEANLTFDGSNLVLTGNMSASGHISASTVVAGVYYGDGSNLSGVSADSFDFDGLDAVTSLNQGDIFGVSVSGTEKKITYSNLEDDIFGNLGGDVSVAAGGSVSVNSVQANSVALGTDTTGNYVATVADAGTGAGIVIGGATGEGQAATVKVDLNDLSAATVSVANDSIAIIDADDNTSKKESIADLAPAMVSTGIQATNGRFSTNDSEIDHDSLNNFSADEHFTQANITTVGTVTAGSVTAILPSGTVTGSAQVAMGGDISGNANNATVAKVQGVALTSGEATQLANINSVTITNTQWGYVGAMNQGVTSTSDVNFNDLTLAGDLTVNGSTTTLSTTNLNVEDKYILLHSGSSGTVDSGVIFGGTSGTDGQGKALIWDASYNTNDGRLAVSTTDVTAESTSNFGAGTAGYYVAGVFEGTAANAATAKADHNGNIRIESNEIYIYA